VNAETVALLTRPYQDIVDDILTAIVGGVVNEPIFFELTEDTYRLSQPARDLRGVTSVVNAAHHTFRKDVDFAFSEGDNAVVWLPKGDHPDDESPFYVDYVRRDARSPLSDINIGSVTRTLGEAIGREIATVYRQIDLAYLAGFIDTAEGHSLDLVVSILGVTRKTKDFAVGLVTFFRDPAVPGTITVPQATLLSTTKGEVTFETTEPRTLQRGQVRIDVPVRAAKDFKGDQGKVEAGKITVLAQTLAGVARVTNFEATILGAEDETDQELRERARAAIRGLGQGTLLALARAIFERRGKLLEAWDPNSPPRVSAPGTVTLLVETEPERFPSLRAAVEETRAAGVQVTLVARYVFMKLHLTVKIAAGLPAAGKDKLVQELIAALQQYVDGLSSGDPAKGQDLLKALATVKDVGDPKIVEVQTSRSDLGASGPSNQLVDAIVSAVQAVPAADAAALRAAVLGALTGEAAPLAPSGGRVPDRSLVKGPTGAPATDAEIEAGTFQVVAVIDGQPWSVFLDMEPADILMVEG